MTATARHRRDTARGTAGRIAVVGIGCRLPGARDHRAYWTNLDTGVCSVREITPDRWDTGRHYSPDPSRPDTAVSKWCGLLDRPYAFDHAFFRLSPRDAALMDPQQRLVLEETWHCVEDAGIPLRDLSRARTAVYVGVMARDHLQETARDGAPVESHSGLGGYDCLLANRVSHTLGLRGASVSVDAACASSLVAVHSGMRALLDGEADYVLAGGVSLNLHPWKYLSFSKARMLSPEGLCKTFSDDADGYVPGDGVAMVLLRPLEDAVRDGNHVYGVLAGSAVNHVGRGGTITAPSADAQREVVSAALARAGWEPRTVTYVEAHGTGTSLGDPIEVEALHRVFSPASAQTAWCRIGSVKPNIGHLEAAAGVAGLIKVLMMMRARTVPPSLHIRDLNPLIRWADSPFEVTRHSVPWQPHREGQPLRAGVSSFGMGGVNAHVVVEEYEECEEHGEHGEYGEYREPTAVSPVPSGRGRRPARGRHPFLLSARSPRSLGLLLARWREEAAAGGWAGEPAADICRTLAAGREHFPYRFGGLVSDTGDIAALLRSAPPSPAAVAGPWRLVVGPLAVPPRRRLAGLLASPLYADAVAGLRAHSPASAAGLRELRRGGESPHHAFLFTYLTVRALLDAGFAPGTVTGQGAGVWPALAAAGVLDVQDAAALARGDEPGGSVAPRAPRIAFAEPVTGRLLSPYRLDADYLTALREGLRAGADEVAALHGRAARLADVQHTFRGHLREWDRLLAERGEGGPRLPGDGDEWRRSAGDTAGPAATLRALAVQNALDLVHRKWGIDREREIGNAEAREVLDLLALDVLTREDAIALVLGDGTVPAEVAERAHERLGRIPGEGGGCPLLRARSAPSAGVDELRSWAATPAAESPADAGEAVLAVGAVESVAAEVVVDGPETLADSLAGPLLELWLRGVGLDWRRTGTGAPGRVLSLPTTEFVRGEHRLRRETGAAEAAPGTGGRVPGAEARVPGVRARVPGSDGDLPARGDGVALRELSRRLRDAPLPEGRPRVGGPLLIVVPERCHEEVREAVREALPGDRPRWVLLGGAYGHDEDTGAWTVRAAEEGDWRRLFTALEAEGEAPSRIIHLVAPRPGTSVGERLTETVYGAFLLAKAAGAAREDGRTEVICLRPAGAGAPGAGEPETAALGGLARALRRETARVRLRTVTVDGGPADPDVWRCAAAEWGGDDDTVHVAGGTRRVARYEEAEGAPAAYTGVRPGGVYLVSGGAGGLGRIVAGHLLRTEGVRVALVGRSELSAERSAAPAGLLGGDHPRAVYLRADVADAEQAEAVVARVRARWGRIDGVLHAAGVLRDGLLATKGLDDVRSVFASKVLGADRLDRATRDDPLDFFVLFSSVVAVSGNTGQTDYAAANAYLDAYADQRERLRGQGLCSGRTVAVGWPLWEGGGMTVAEGSGGVFRPERGVFPLPAPEGLALLDRVLAGPAGHRAFVHATGEGAAWLSSGGREDPGPVARERAADAGAGEPLERAVRYATGVLAGLLGVAPDQVDADLGFDEYGIDSIRVSQFNACVERDLGPVPQTLLFECRTLAQAAERIAAHRPAELAAWCADQEGTGREDASRSGDGGTDTGVRPDGAAPAVRHVVTARAESGARAEGGADREAIAVIGMSGRYPMAPDLDAFWRNLADGRDCVTGIPPARRTSWGLTATGELPRESGIDCSSGGFLDGVDRFDPLFFHISPREAEAMDPQERIFLEVAWSAFEDAGYPPMRLGDPDDPAQRRVGVFAGVTTQTYLLWGPERWSADDPVIPTSTPWSVANRISYWLDLHGPSMPVDTACASSLHAVHLARESLARGECDMALVGGVNLYLHPAKYRWLSQMGMLSRTGRCHAFGEAADGFVPGEGAGALLLKPLRRALADGDRVLGLVRGTSVNHGGRTSGFTVPNPRAQAELVRAALRDAGVAPESVGYVEAHGTGTALGDPIEIAGLTQAFRDVPVPGRGEGDGCALGSVKTNIGHLESAAGIAGLTKVLLQLRHGTLVPSLHAERENPRLDLAGTPFRLQRDASPWPRKTGADGRELPRRAGISSFGAGGANAHVVVEEYRGPRAPRGAPDGEHLIVVSAKDAERLREHCANLARHLAGPHADLRLSEVAHQLQVRRQPLPERVALLASDPRELAGRLAEVAGGRPPADRCWTPGDRTPAARRAAREAVPDALASRDLATLAECWVAGAEVPWARLHPEPLRHVELPVYPFARERHWLPEIVRGAAAEAGENPGRAEDEPGLDEPGLDEPGLDEPGLDELGLDEPGLDESSAVQGPAGPVASRGLAGPVAALRDPAGHPFVTGVSEAAGGTFADFTGEESFLDDHRVDGVPIFPAVGYLEMVREATRLLGRPAVRLRNNVWSEAMTVPAPARFHLGLERGADTWSYELYSVDGDGGRRVHGRGKADTTAAEPAGEDRFADLDGIRGRCEHRADAGEFYALVHGLGLGLGAAYQGVRRVWWSEGEALTEIRLPEAAEAGADRFFLHPSMLDSALQASLWLIERREGRGRLHLPFTIGSLDVAHGTPRRGYAHVVVRAWTEAGKKIEVRLCDERGRVLLTVRDFWLRPWRTAAPAPAAPAAPTLAPEPTPEPEPERSAVRPAGTFFRPAWTPGGPPADTRRALTGILVLAPSPAAGHALASAVASGGTIPGVVVTPGAAFHRSADGGGRHTVTLRPSHAGDAERLAGELTDLGVLGGARGREGGLGIVHALPASVFTGGADAVRAQLDDGLMPLFHLVRALLRSGDRGPVRLVCAYPGTGGEQPGYAALGGFLRTLARESVRFSTALVELPAAELAGLAGGDAAARTLAAELHGGSGAFAEIRHRDGRRAVRTWTAHSTPLTGGGAVLRPRGVHLVTGGTGGIGTLVARRLADRYGARLVLAGRSPHDERVDALLARIAEDGGEAHYVRADTSRPEGAADAVRAAQTAFGEVHGVFHCAGVLRDGYLVHQDPRRLREVLAPKLWGAFHLDAATRGQPLDVFCLFSSVAAPLGSAGQAGYAYANGFLDSFARWRDEQCRRGARRGHTTAVNWPLWQDGGMTVDDEVRAWLRAGLGLLPLETGPALAALDAVLDGPPGPVLFVGGDGAKVAELLGAEPSGDPAQGLGGEGDGRPAAAGSPVDEGEDTVDHPAPAPALQTALRAVLTDEAAGIVKLDPARIDPAASIGDYGFDSLSFSRFANRLNERLGLDITPATFFEYTTVDDLTDHFLETFPDEIGRHVGAPAADDRPAPPSEPDHPAASATATVREAAPAAPALPSDAAPAGLAAPAGPEPIAIVGMHAEMPGCPDLDAYWRHIEAGDELISEIPADRWDWRDHYDPTGRREGTTVSKWGGFLPEVDTFDARFFGVSPREAQLMDPQQRLFLQTAHRAVEEAGYRPSDLSAGRTGLFVGVATHEYYDLLREAGVPTEAYTTTGLFHAILANRVSYLMNLSGPSFPIDTACSSSLVALRTAVESLRAGSCDTALVGGVNLLLSPTIYVSFSRAGMLSPDGRCKTFDAAADGYVRGEGAAALLLKPLSAAVRDGDHVHAVIRGSAVNHGGRVNTLTTPNPNAQSSLIVAAFEEAGVDPETVGYVEMHGTGTALGDPIEINGLKKAFRELRDRAGRPRLTEPCTAIGSVKPVIGHLEAAAGMAGVVKAVLAMRHGRLPGSPHIRELNPHIQLQGGPLRIPRTTEPWPRRTGPDGRELPRRAAVSSFGFGGTNGHVLLEEHLPHTPGSPLPGTSLPGTSLSGASPERVFVLSARTGEQLREYAGRMAAAVADGPAGPGAADAGTRTGSGADGIEPELIALVADALGVLPDEVPTDEPLGDLGLGPLAFGALREWIADRCGPADGGGEPLAACSVKDVVTRLAPASLTARRDLRDLAYTLHLGREHREHRLAVVCADARDLAASLAAFTRGEAPDGRTWHGVTGPATTPATERAAGLPRPDREDPRTVARRWTEGADIAWERLYPGERPRRLSLPPHPFARTRYWVPGAPDRERTWTQRVRLDASDRRVLEHLVHGRPVLPGVAHLALAHTALRTRRTGDFRLTGAVWLRPLDIEPGHPREVEVRLREKDGLVEYEVVASSGTRTPPVTCSRGTWEERPADSAFPGPDPVDLAALRRRCPTRLDRHEVYERFGALGLEYGPLFRGLREVRVGESDVLAAYGTTEAGTVPGDPAFHPTVLDAALQAVSAFDFTTPEGRGPTRLPFALDSADLGEPLPGTGHIHVHRAPDGRIDVTVLDDTGRGCAALWGVTVRERRAGDSGDTGAAGDAGAAERPSHDERRLERFFHEPHWAEQPLPGGPETPRAPEEGTLLVHPADCLGLDRALASRTRARRIRLGAPGTPTRPLADGAWEADARDDTALRELLLGAGEIRHLWYLTGPPVPDTEGGFADPVDVFFRLVKALSDTDRTPSLRSLRVVTAGVHDVDGTRTGNPRAAGLGGLCKTLAKEYPHLDVGCLDLALPTGGGTEPPEGTVDALLAEPAQRAGEEVALRAGRRYVKRLRPVPLPAPSRPVYRQGGTYLVVGGTGGIGRTLAEHLAKSAAARLVLTGRSAPGPDTDRLVARVAELGGQALYVPADVTDPAALRNAVEAGRARFGAYHGVFHAAMVLRDSIVERMDTEAFHAVYGPKARGSAVLGALFADEPLDFLLFLSSVQSFTGSAGQGNYAAGSTAQDAHARELAGRAAHPVQVVNWGVWGGVGAVAAPRYREELRARGFRPIEPADGMAALERVLASGRRQVVALDADDHVLHAIGVRDDGPAPAGTAPRPAGLMADSARHLAGERALEEFIAREVCGLLGEAGLFRRPGQEHHAAEPARALGASPRHRRLVDGLVEVLVRGGYAVRDGDRVRATARVLDAEGARSGEAAAGLRSAHPDLGARLDLVRACLDDLPRVLTGALSPAEVLFPGGSGERVAPVYRGSPLVDHCNRLLAAHVVDHLRATVSPGRRPRVLEIGAGTGATTAEVLDALRAAGIEADYDYTDVSVSFLREAGRRWAGRSGVRMTFRSLDIARSAGAQGFEAGGHDVVIAANVLHAVADLDGALGRARALLRPSGRLLLTEVTRMLGFHTVTFGLLDGWWAQTDPERRLPFSPLLDEEMWRRRLAWAGFTGVEVRGEADTVGRLSQRVITAVPDADADADADAHADGHAGPVTVPGAVDVGRGPVPGAVEKSQGPVTVPTSALADGPGEPGDFDPAGRVAGLITALAAEALGMSAAELEPDRPLSSYGVDSIVGVELINRINRELGIVLKTIAIFDHPTVRELAAFVAERYASAVGERLRPAPAEAAPAPAPATAPATPPVQSAPEPRGRTAPVAVAGGGFRAVRFERPGNPADLAVVPVEPVAPGPGEVEVAVRAFPVNFSDFLAAKGLYPMMPDFPFTPGVEVSGVVRRVGPGVRRVRPGDEVVALTRPEMGGQASVVLTDDTFVVRKPARLTHEEACGMPVAFLAMWLAFERAGVRAGDRVLIRAATGTNGLVAVQLARAAGAEVIATAGGPRKVAHLVGMGVADPIDHERYDVVEEVRRRTGGAGADVVVNTLGDGATQEGLNLLAPDGRYVEIAVFGLQAAGGLDLSRMVDNQSFHSFNTKKYFLAHPERRVPCLEAMAEHLEAGTVRPYVAHVVPFDRVTEAYALKAERGTIGRVVVTVPDPDATAVSGTSRPERHSEDGSRARRKTQDTTAPAPAPAPVPVPVPVRGDDIAVIGMSGRYPGADTLAELWDNLARGECAAGEVPSSRWSAERYHDPDPARLDTTYCSRGAFLDDVDAFDAPFFAMSGKEAAQTDPQQRLFLEEAWRALEDAGYPSGALEGRPCGVFVGVGPSEYLTRMNRADVLKEAQSFWGNEASVLAARISYFLNLKGPSLAVNTACSSSLVAVHLACRSLLSGECETALAGGVFLTLAPDYFVVASNGTMLAPDGVCKTFDDSADGFGPGEGVGALVLKPLRAALRDGDHVHGVIKGSAINQDGRTNGITAPSGAAQTAVELAAWERAGIGPETLGYVEAHGTGTRLGDPIEVEALANAFARHTDRKAFCPIGSVKTNIGHTAAAAGIAGIIKVLLAFRHDRLPPSANYRTPNRLIDFPDTPFYVNTALSPWPDRDGAPRRAAVSSFGFSGTNAHLVLEEPPVDRPAAPAERARVAVPLSARTRGALAARRARLADWLEGEGAAVSLTEVAATLQLHRDHFPERAVFVVGDRAELTARLRAFATGGAESAGGAESGQSGGGADGAEAPPEADDPVLAEAAARYLAGQDVEWRALWPEETVRRTPLPTYPFDRHRYWFTERDTVYAAGTDAAPRLAPVGPAGATPLVWEAELTGAEFYLTDHRVEDRPTLPGVLGPELALQAARRSGVRADAVTHLRWLRPLVADGTPLRVTVRLEPDGDSTRFEIRSGDTPHARGTLEPRGPGEDAPRADVAALRRSCPRSVPVADHYRFLTGMGLHHGPALACVRDLRVGEDQVLARLTLPAPLEGTRGDYRLHPSLADGALQVLAAMPFLRDLAPPRPLLPVALGALIPPATALPPSVLVHAVVHPASAGPGTLTAPSALSALSTFDIRLLDDEGRALLSLERLTIKMPDAGAAAPPASDLTELLRRFRDGEIGESEAESALEAFLAE
ncbi:SDR family NAD(P)-dependent oxidoreductase [Streptomyces tagetis]|uniref:SDR family NAD(P)-dependent oxidoreductase n=1 Tax=Streptomyces tagetis TaxID=2820809 RepID=A0A940XE28_9ACTN|nr:SDR family NAD(P)-dependent oxidoreductase [Streptomyces sp. RG38]MBQ0826804.1 SDR family NAD(P)-dependent oxidoreductase [Streptomyces sp. RG38]